MTEQVPRPKYLKPAPLNPPVIEEMTRLMRDLSLHTICESARCPNRTDCFGHATATFLILGNTCTRHCTFCAVNKGVPEDIDPEEPVNIVRAIERLQLKYVVITSVTRDDRPDGGAAHFARTVEKIKEYDAKLPIEVLIPDFKGETSALKMVLDAHPAVLNHNIETVPRLYPVVRPEADYRRSLTLLAKVKELDATMVSKSGIMLGLGESLEEVIQVMTELRASGCDILTIGQYLAPSFQHYPVVRYASEEEFVGYESAGREMGFSAVIAGPFVRSSFHAVEAYKLVKKL